MTTEPLPDNKFGTASFALAIAIAGSALLMCHFALRTSSSGALLVAAGSERVDTAQTPPSVVALDETRSHGSERVGIGESGSGIVLTGRVSESTTQRAGERSIVVEHGAIDPRDRHEWEVAVAEGVEMHPLESLYSFVVGERATVDSSGRFEVAVAEAPRYRVLIHDEESSATREIALAQAQPDPRDGSRLALDLGEIRLEPMSRLEIEVEQSGVVEFGVGGPFRVEMHRAAPTPFGSEWSWRLRHLSEYAADVLLHGASIELPNHGLRMPVLPDESFRVRLLSSASVRSREYEVTVARGELHRLVIPLREAFPARAHARFAVRLVYADSGLPIADAAIRFDDRNLARTDAEGRFEFVAERVERRTLTIAQFDPELPDRQEFVEIAPVEGSEESTIVLEPTRWLQVTGIGPPPEFSGNEPQAYRLEMRRPGGAWSAVALDVMKRDGDVLSISITRGEAEYRAVALWSAICAVESEPVAILATDRVAYTAFPTPREAPRFVQGRLIGADGTALPGVTVEATAPGCGGIPPVPVVTDRAGSFTIGPIRARRIEVVAHAPSGDVIREVDPQQETELAIDLRNEPAGGG